MHSILIIVYSCCLNSDSHTIISDLEKIYDFFLKFLIKLNFLVC